MSTRVKPDVETLLTLPDDPPEAGPDRALELAAPGPLLPEPEGFVAAELDVDAPHAAQSPIAAHISARAIIRSLRLDGSQRVLGPFACVALVTGADGPMSAMAGHQRRRLVVRLPTPLATRSIPGERDGSFRGLLVREQAWWTFLISRIYVESDGRFCQVSVSCL